nr:hypothetical protein [Lactobacillus apis]
MNIKLKGLTPIEYRKAVLS